MVDPTTRMLLSEFLELAYYAGKRPDFVQGAGGNVSVKNMCRMYIKASGSELKAVTRGTGFVVYDLAKERLETTERTQRLSMESGFHRILGKYVIHTHPLAVGPLVCSNEGKSLTRELFREGPYRYYWVDYSAPGKVLARNINILMQRENVDMDHATIFFLQNHGLIVSAPTLELCQQAHEDTLAVGSAYFGQDTIGLQSDPLGDEKYLIPDQVIYAKTRAKGLTGTQQAILDELHYFSRVVLNAIERRGLSAKYLSEDQINELLTMDEEKYRQEAFLVKE